MESTILSKCLELTRDLKALNTSFDITIKLDNMKVRFSSDDDKKDKKNKSPSQQKRDFERKQGFLANRTAKSDSNNAINPVEAVSNKNDKQKTVKTNSETNEKCDKIDKRQDNLTEIPKSPEEEQESLLKMKASIRQEVFETLTPCENCESLWEYEDDMRYHLPWCQENRPT